MAEGVTHISCHHTRIRSRETGENRKTNEQTDEQTWGYQEQRGVCNTTCMCVPNSRYGLTLAWVTSENSTMLLESDILRLFFTGPHLVSSPLCSGVWCWLPLRSSTPTSAACLSALLWPTPNCLSWSPATNCPVVSCPTTNSPLSWVASSTLIRLPVPLPGTARFHVQESFVWFRAKTDNWIVCFGSLPT